MLGEVRRRAGWEAGPEAFSERLDPETFVSRNGSSGLQIRFSSDEPGQAARAANAYAEVVRRGGRETRRQAARRRRAGRRGRRGAEGRAGGLQSAAPDLRGHRRGGGVAARGRRRPDTGGKGERLAGRARRRTGARGCPCSVPYRITLRSAPRVDVSLGAISDAGPGSCWTPPHP